MKKLLCFAACLIVFNLASAFGQPTAPTPPKLPVSNAPPAAGSYQARLQEIIQRANPPADQPPALTKFNLDFPGGPPKELVAAIEKAMGKPLNAIIPEEYVNEQLPPLKMNDVNAPQLFQALIMASAKQVRIDSPDHRSYSLSSIDFGFKTTGTASDNSIWYFFEEKPAPHPEIQPEKICEFFLLEPYLKRGFTVDDITTAIQTGWKMLGDTSPPEISFHKETKLLIAVGEPDKLKVIDNVLKELGKSDYKLAPAVDPNTGLPLSTTEPKTEKSGK